MKSQLAHVYLPLLPGQAIAIASALLDALGRRYEETAAPICLSPRQIVREAGASVADLFDRAIAERGWSDAAADLTPFTAPELTGRLANPADERADFYCLGALLYWLVSGSAPFEHSDPLTLMSAILNKPPAALSDAVPPCVRDVIEKLVRKDPDERYQSVAGLRHDLKICEQILRGDRHLVLELGAHDRRSRPAGALRLVGREAPTAALVRGVR